MKMVVDWEDSTPLDWWSRSSYRYPRLARLAMQYLAIPATSVPSERAFSTAGYIVNEKRSCLLPRMLVHVGLSSIKLTVVKPGSCLDTVSAYM